MLLQKLVNALQSPGGTAFDLYRLHLAVEGNRHFSQGLFQIYQWCFAIGGFSWAVILGGCRFHDHAVDSYRREAAIVDFNGAQAGKELGDAVEDTGVVTCHALFAGQEGPSDRGEEK